MSFFSFSQNKNAVISSFRNIEGFFIISVLILTRVEKLSAEILNRPYENIILPYMIEYKKQNNINHEVPIISLYQNEICNQSHSKRFLHYYNKVKREITHLFFTF